MTQPEAASFLGVSRNRYMTMERDGDALFFELPLLDKLRDYEKCFILRRRSGQTIPMAADSLGISRYWYNQMELGKAPADRLVEHWKDK